MFGMKKIMSSTAVAAVIGWGFASGAQAATITEITLDRNATSTSWQTSWGPAIIGGETLSALGQWSFTGVSGDTWNFTLDLANNANSGARITSWGFDTTPTASDFTITVSNNWTAGGGQGPMTVDHCSFAGAQNCAGGGGGGLSAGSMLTFNFSFDSTEDELTLNDFKTRWQSVGIDDQDSTVLTAASPIPLPAAGWLLLTAMGGLGFAAHRRRKAT